MQRTIEANGRLYNWPTEPVVGICIDGSQPAIDGQPGYIEEAVKAGVAPYFEKLLSTGTSRLARSVVPSFTNPNNLSIVTGQPPKEHGIAGNYFYDQTSKQEVMMNDPEFLRADTIFKRFQEAVARICLITAKDKLRRLLGYGLDMTAGNAICFSAESSDEATIEENGIANLLELANMPVPDVYSAELSEFVFAAGLAIMGRFRPDLVYLSTTDFLQHSSAPGSEEANSFYAMIDKYLRQFDEMGCILSITADHGMTAKHDSGGQPQIIYLQSLIEEWIGPGNARVILPITDPYVGHHGSLGSFATLHIEKEKLRAQVADKLVAKSEIMAVYSKAEACTLV